MPCLFFCIFETRDSPFSDFNDHKSPLSGSSLPAVGLHLRHVRKHFERIPVEALNQITEQLITNNPNIRHGTDEKAIKKLSNIIFR
jgi:hypothetical protein